MLAGTGPCLLAGLGLWLLGSVLACVVVPDVTTQGVVSLELLPTELADVRKVLVELFELLVELPAAPAHLPVVLLPLVPLEQLGLVEDLGAETAGVDGLPAPPGLPLVLHDAAGVDGDPGGVAAVDVLHQLLPAGVPLLAEAAAEVFLLGPLLAPQLLTGLVGVKVPEVTGEGIVGFEFLLADHTDVLEMLEIFLEILVVPLATPTVGLAMELEFVFLKQLELRETDLRNDNISVLNILSSPTLSFSLSLSPYKYHSRC